MKLLRIAALSAVILALLVVMLGAYTRLTNAGLGCPDWPGCYGQLVLPSAQSELANAQREYPQSPIESGKAWTEMAHRYAAGTLALLVVFIAWRSLKRRSSVNKRLPWVLPFALLMLIGFQATLGMWTVTLKLLPVVVMGHLLGGILIFSCLCYFCWQLSAIRGQNCSQWRGWISLGIVIVFCQIALGGWVSSNYAGLACIGFPQCNGQWIPALHFSQGFNLFSAIGANYQGGLLDNESRVTIQFIHRLGAYVTAVYVLVLAGLIVLRVPLKNVRKAALVAILLIVTQFVLGIINVVYLLPLWASVLHNGVAALLLASMVSLRYFLTEGARYA